MRLVSVRTFFQTFWKSIFALAAFVGVLSLPTDISELPQKWGVPPGKFREVLEVIISIDRDQILILIIAICVFWIVWIDARPYAARWSANRRSSTYWVDPSIYQESYWIKDLPEIYLHKYYICIGNRLADGKTIKRVQGRIFGYSTPLLCPIKGSDIGEIDLRHGEYVFFQIGCMASKTIGPIKGSEKIDEEKLKSYFHNVNNGYLVFELMEFPNKNAIGLSGGSGDSSAGVKSSWRINIIITADETKSQTISVMVDFTKEEPAISILDKPHTK